VSSPAGLSREVGHLLVIASQPRRTTVRLSVTTHIRWGEAPANLRAGAAVVSKLGRARRSWVGTEEASAMYKIEKSNPTRHITVEN
jgi:hypothetical protein